MATVCEICGKATMYHVTKAGLDVCEECIDYARSITDPDTRRDLYGKVVCTLDGEPARVTGYLNDFGTVASSKAAYQWSWRAIARVMSRTGRFQS